MIKVKRIHDPPEAQDGFRILVDRLFPRGLSKESAQIHLWAKELAPSRELRKWFGHDPERWEQFREKYQQELADPSKRPLLEEIGKKAQSGEVTLLFAARDVERNNAIVLRDVLTGNPRVTSGDPRAFETLVNIIDYLRSPQGCPWDREQTHASLGKYLLEECYETLECLDKGQSKELAEELGDVLLQVVLHSQIAQEHGEFDVGDVIESTTSKLIQRHPHVFGDVKLATARDVEAHWEEFKGKKEEKDSILDGVPKEMPALAYSQEIQSRAASTGFDWEDVVGVLDKVEEEMRELKAASTKEEAENELGDVLLALVNLGRKMGIEVEAAARKANHRFYQRFHYMEQQARSQGKDFRSLSLDEKNALWEEAKEQE